ncbi:uncharacterized protein TNCV_3027311 [Trichonephila clavipes]|nr:uncharacterized protein TNCV_3027311 [Trichonephila clavipes]
MSEGANACVEQSEGAIQITSPPTNPPVPPQDLSLNLDLYNYDTADAQACPYVLTSPRSLEACSRVGVKPVDLLHKTLAEFSDDIEPDKPLEEIVKLYDEYEQQRIILLQKCQAEREFLIWRSTSKRRSHSLSPCRRSRLQKQQKSKGDFIIAIKYDVLFVIFVVTKLNSTVQQLMRTKVYSAHLSFRDLGR